MRLTIAIVLIALLSSCSAKYHAKRYQKKAGELPTYVKTITVIDTVPYLPPKSNFAIGNNPCDSLLKGGVIVVEDKNTKVTLRGKKDKSLSVDVEPKKVDIPIKKDVKVDCPTVEVKVKGFFWWSGILFWIIALIAGIYFVRKNL